MKRNTSSFKYLPLRETLLEILKKRRAKRPRNTRSERRNKTHKILRPLKCPWRAFELSKILARSDL
jgi:hypothetical protein